VSGGDLITDRQLKMIYALKMQLGIRPDYEHFSGITRRQAKHLIDGLLDELNARKGSEGGSA
jgi:hypothetical protein